MYFATWLFNADGGVEVTGSHLDKEWNGFKLCIGSESTTENHIREMLQTAQKLEVAFKAGYLSFKSTEKGELEEVDYDAGNGTTGVIAPPLFRALGAEVFELYSEPDGNFPHHLPDPTIPRFLKDLHVEVVRNDAHIGLSSDCDGDRAGAVSPSGRMIIGEQILALLCKQILKEHPRAKIVYDTKCSDAIREIITENGGTLVEWKTGFSFIKAKVDEVGAVAGGEMSGHVYFAKNNRADDAVFAFSELLLLTTEELPTQRDKNIVDGLLEDFLERYVNTPEIRIPVVSDEEKERVSDVVENYYRELAANSPERYKRRIDENGNDIDGVKIEFVEENGWALIRRSNMSPVIILRMEARNENRTGLERLRIR